jgi:hypothetical protein
MEAAKISDRKWGERTAGRFAGVGKYHNGVKGEVRHVLEALTLH